MTTENTTYLITGATRGIGRALVEYLSTRSNVTIIAGVRDAKHVNAKPLLSKPNVIVVEIDSLRDDTPVAAAKHLEAQGVRVIDVVIANAGITVDKAASLADVNVSELRKLLNVNAVAPVLLFSAFKPFLTRATNPRFFVNSSISGSFARQAQLFNAFETKDGKPKPGYGIYATSKATVNILTKRIALEEPWLIAVPFHPGLVATDMPTSVLGPEAIKGLVDGGHALSPEQSANAIVKLVESAQRETHSGRFYDVQLDQFSEF